MAKAEVTNISAQVDEAKLAELEASLSEEDMDAWDPSNGEVLSGKIVSIETRNSKYGKYPGVGIQKADGTEVMFHAYRTVAINELLRIKPVVGDLIAVAFYAPSEDQDYYNYKIKVSREIGVDFAWDQFTSKERKTD